MPSRLITLLLLSLLSLTACKRSASVSGVWREAEELTEDETKYGTDRSSALYELNLGQYGDRV